MRYYKNSIVESLNIPIFFSLSRFKSNRSLCKSISNTLTKGISGVVYLICEAIEEGVGTYYFFSQLTAFISG